jgi:hypothetical protein
MVMGIIVLALIPTVEVEVRVEVDVANVVGFEAGLLEFWE